jgi:hypothetical protein
MVRAPGLQQAVDRILAQAMGHSLEAERCDKIPQFIP